MELTIGTKVRIKTTPYNSVVRNSVGEIVSSKFKGTSIEQFRVKFKNGEERPFYPSEFVIA